MTSKDYIKELEAEIEWLRQYGRMIDYDDFDHDIADDLLSLMYDLGVVSEALYDNYLPR